MGMIACRVDTEQTPTINTTLPIGIGLTIVATLSDTPGVDPFLSRRNLI
jgi:hypothetical protein